MTLYYSGEDDGCDGGTEGVEEIIENNPDYVEFDDEGRLVLNLDEMHEDKRMSLLNAAVSAVKASEKHVLTQEPEWVWGGGNDA